MNKLYEIHTGTVTLYLSHYKEREFQLQGFTADSDNEWYFTLSIYEPSPCEDRKTVKLTDYMYQMYKTEADRQLRQYIDDHINDYDFYTECDEDGLIFLRKVINRAGCAPEIFNNYDLHLNEITYGIVGITINQVVCRYSFVDGKTITIKSPGCNDSAYKTPMDIFYKSYLNEFVALEQYKRGIGVPAYTELVRLKQFLKDKKSVKFVMKSGTVHELKSDSLRVSDIIAPYSDNGGIHFHLNHSYHLKPNIERNLPLSSLDYLQFGKHKFYINVQKLTNYTKPNITTL